MKILLQCFLSLCLVSFSSQTLAPDHEIVGDAVSFLTTWSACSSNASISCIKATVPGDIISDLENAGLVQDTLFDLNFKNDSLWADEIWTYSTQFQLTDEQSSVLASGGAVLIVFDGVKGGATVTLNDVDLGWTIQDQFLRYQFAIDQTLLQTLSLNKDNQDNQDNSFTLKVKFDPTINVAGRFMASTGGWDWAPYTLEKRQTADTHARTFSYGIWRHVSLVTVSSTALTYIVPHVFYTGAYPNSPLSSGAHAPFLVRVRVHFSTSLSASVSGTLSVTIDGVNSTTLSDVTLRTGDSNVTVEMLATQENVRLWWPTKVGEDVQQQYTVNVTFVTTKGVILTGTRLIGFRFVALVTGDDSDDAYVAANANANGNEHGSGSQATVTGMRFRVNGVPVYLRGANLIPMDEREGRWTDEAYTQMLINARDAGMNMIRVWGGGVFQSETVYSAADSLGLLVYHDMQYAQEGHSPAVSDTQEREFRHQIRRLSHHASIMVWDGCNECQVVLNTPTGIYATFVLATVVEEDMSRIVWPSCPSSGWDSGVNRLSSLPNGQPLLPHVPVSGESAIEVHGPYQHGTGFPAVNGGDSVDPFDPMLPNVFTSASVSAFGFNRPSVFVSEFGAVSMSSFESMSTTLSKQHWSLHGDGQVDTCTGSYWGDFDRVCTGGNVMAERNYPCDSLIDAYFGSSLNLSAVGEVYFRGQLYQCMIAQALQIKGEIERQRARNVFGTIIWQLGEIWPTGGWGSLEYGIPSAVGSGSGSVLGGRWKPLHHFLDKFLFRDVIVGCGLNGTQTQAHSSLSSSNMLPASSLVCFVRNDGPALTLHAIDIAIFSISLVDNNRTTLYTNVLPTLPASPYMYWFSVPSSSPSLELDVTSTLVYALVKGAGKATIASNYHLLTAPSKLVYVNPTVDARVNIVDVVAGVVNDVGLLTTAIVYIANNGPGVALYVTLTTEAQGRFDDNAFVLPPTPVEYYSCNFVFAQGGGAQGDLVLLAQTLKIAHVGMYQSVSDDQVVQQ